MCPLCKSNHDKNHLIINYEDKNYICKKHNDSFTKFCKTCNEDICIICENEHKNHDKFDFSSLIINKNELLKSSETLYTCHKCNKIPQIIKIDYMNSEIELKCEEHQITTLKIKHKTQIKILILLKILLK